MVLNKKKYSLFLVFAVFFSFPSYSIDQSGPYAGVALNAIYYKGYSTSNHSCNGAGFSIDRTNEKEGYGGGVYGGWTFKEGFWTLSPELGFYADNGYQKKYGKWGVSDLSIEYNRPFNVSASLVAGYALNETYDIQGLMGINFTRFKLVGKEKDSTPFTKNKGFYNMGVALGVGVEKKFKNWAIGCMLQQTVYLIKRSSFIDNDGDLWTSKYRPSLTKFSLRFKIPLSL